MSDDEAKTYPGWTNELIDGIDDVETLRAAVRYFRDLRDLALYDAAPAGSPLHALHTFTPTFQQRGVVLVIIGHDGAQRIWKAEELATLEQVDWGARQLEEVAVGLRKFVDGAGTA